MEEYYPINTNVNGTPMLIAKNTNPGVRLNTRNLHSKQPSSIAQRLKAAGVDWVVDFAAAIKANKRERIAMWMKLLPYLIVTQGHRSARKLKGRASKAALQALNELEGR